MKSKETSTFLIKCKLYQLIQNSKIHELIQFIQVYGYEFDYFDNSITFLTLAITKGNANVVQILLQAKANVNLLSQINYKWPNDEMFSNLESALITATREGYYDICRILLDSNANVNKTDSCQMTALHWACELDHVDIVDLLINANATINCVDSKGYMPIELCIMKNNEDSFRYLIDNVDIQFCFYKLLFLTMQNFNYVLLQALMKKCKNGKIIFDINQIDGKVGSLLHYAVILSNFDKDVHLNKPQILSVCYLKTIELLILNGAEVNLINKLGETPLHLCRNCSVVDLLLTYGACMNVKEITGKTPLFTYFCRANYDICLELLKHGSESEIIDRFGNSLLYTAIHSNAPIKFIRLLLEAGVDLNHERWFIEKLFPLRLRNKHPRLIKFIEWRSRNPLSLKELCRKQIRTYLNQVNENKSVVKRVLHLPVPSCLQDYILFNLK